jgi:drug/metabolite transporter (DMT)-like permease
MFLYAVLRSELSVIIPLLGLTPVMALGFGMLVLGEEPTLIQDIGILAIVVGALGLTATRRDLRRPWRVLVAPLLSPGGALMIGVAVCWALAPFFDKLALNYSSEGAHGAVLSGGVGIVLAAGLVLLRRGAGFMTVGSHKRLFALGGVFALLALGTQLVAVQLMLVSLFEGLKRALGMSASVLGGRLFFGEAITAQKLVSAATMTLGVLLLV